MSAECLKLTAYFGERQRAGRRLYADELLDTFAHHELATSILLRGSAGFGSLHHARSDQSLTMSEDPPMVGIVVDSRERIQELLTDVTSLNGRGVLTLERVRLVRDEDEQAPSPGEVNDATKLTVYVGRQAKVGRVPAFVSACDLLYRKGVAGASVLVGVDGTANRRRERARFFDANTDVPTMIIAVGSNSRISTVLPELSELLRHPTITLERVRVCKRDGLLLERPHALPRVDKDGLGVWQKLMVHTSESTLHHGEPIHRALVRRLRQATPVRGATVLRGMWGFHGDHQPHGDKLFQLGRHVPVMTVVVDTADRIAQCFDIVDDLTAERGLVTTEMVPAFLSIGHAERYGGLRLAQHDF